MRIGVVSDSHGDLKALHIAMMQLGCFDILLHAGDFHQDAAWAKVQTNARVIAVPGNCDQVSLAPQERRVMVAGKKLWLLHGHRYGIKSGFGRLIQEAHRRRVDLVVFGHTHHPVVFYDRGVCFVNPGSVHDGRGTREAYGIIELHGSHLEAYTCDLVD
ncbi:MAG: metallophosphoesterase [Bacillota bacterium]